MVAKLFQKTVFMEWIGSWQPRLLQHLLFALLGLAAVSGEVTCCKGKQRTSCCSCTVHGIRQDSLQMLPTPATLDLMQQAGRLRSCNFAKQCHAGLFIISSTILYMHRSRPFTAGLSIAYETVITSLGPGSYPPCLCFLFKIQDS